MLSEFGFSTVNDMIYMANVSSREVQRVHTLTRPTSRSR